MWVPEKVVQWLNVSLDTVNALKEKNSALEAERDALKNELSHLKINFDWLRVQVNQLQAERTSLMEKAYGIKVPAPQIARQEVRAFPDQETFSFEDIGDELAKKLGFPTYNNNL